MTRPSRSSLGITAIRRILLNDVPLTASQKQAITSNSRKLLVIAGAGSGKTDVMARRVAWLIAAGNVPKDRIVAFTFTEAAAEELKFRIRLYITKITPPGQDPSLGGMYIGTIHGFCLKTLRDLAADIYYNYDVIDDLGRVSLIQRGYYSTLGLNAFQQAMGTRQFETIDAFMRAYDLLNEYDLLDVELPRDPIPADVSHEREWIMHARLRTRVGTQPQAVAFADCAARYYAQLRCRRFLDFSTSQSELTRLLRTQPQLLTKLRVAWTHIVVDEVQDINPVQNGLIRLLVGDRGSLTAVGDHRQAIYAFRGGRVDLMETLHSEMTLDRHSEVINLRENFRSTPIIIKLANEWVSRISQLGQMPTPPMNRGRRTRTDFDQSHILLRHFNARQQEAEWIASTVATMVRNGRGAAHDSGNRDERGLTLSDIAILVRSSTDVRTYQNALRRHGIHSVVHAGPDLFSQPEVLLFLGLLARAVGIDVFYGRRLTDVIQNVLNCQPQAEPVVRAAAAMITQNGTALPTATVNRLLSLSGGIRNRLDRTRTTPVTVPRLISEKAAAWIGRAAHPRRVFPQEIFHWFLEEAEVSNWDTVASQTVMFHLGQLSNLITSMETPGWTTGEDFKYQIMALLMWGSSSARTEEAPLLVTPDAVTITTVHGAKGLEFAAVFLADVNAHRFPSNWARTVPSVPFDGRITRRIDPARLADNTNLDGERRLMYVALTRAERYLFITCSGNRTSSFIRELNTVVPGAGGTVGNHDPRRLRLLPSSQRRDQRLVTSFSDLRYFLECPHDFYLRKVLGFAPSIDQAFGYGRAVHNILREIHENPKKWGRLARDKSALETELARLMASGLFYLRYTTADPLENMKRTALRDLADYVGVYQEELSRLEFEPEREFETLIEDENLLISGAIDLVKLDNPPRVSIIDFKSGEQGDKNQSGLSQELMALQIGLYGLAARHELEYEPNTGHVRYVGEADPIKRELNVNLDDRRLRETRNIIIRAARQISERQFDQGPTALAQHRCSTCDFFGICGRNEATIVRRNNASSMRPRRRA